MKATLRGFPDLLTRSRRSLMAAVVMAAVVAWPGVFVHAQALWPGAACRYPHMAASNTVAQVGNVRLSELDLAIFRSALEGTGEAYTVPGREALLKYLAGMIRAVSTDDARKITASNAFQSKMALIDNKTIGDCIMASVRDAITDVELHGAYDNYLKKDRRFVRLSQLLVSNSDEAWTLRLSLQLGASFSTLAADHSLDLSSKDNGGDIGTFGPETPIFRIAFSSNPGTILDPTLAPDGWHIIKLQEKGENRLRFEDVKLQLQHDIFQRRWTEFVAPLRRGAELVTVDTPAQKARDSHTDRVVARAGGVDIRESDIIFGHNIIPAEPMDDWHAQVLAILAIL
jgi:peptidyl-prolyl cis-trans isomerase C